MARKKTETQPTEDIDQELQDEAVESQVDETEATEGQPGGVDEPEPSYAEQIGLAGDEWKDFADKDPVTVGKTLAERYAQKEQEYERRLAEQQQRWQQQFVNHPEYIRFQKFQNEQSGRQPEQQEDPLKEWYSPPQIDRALAEQYIEQQPVKDADGNIVGYEAGWKKDTPAELKKAVEDYDLYQRKWRNEFYQDPRAKLMPLIENAARKIAQEQYQTTAQQQREAAFFNDFESKYGDYIYEKDQFGFNTLSPLGRQLLDQANHIYSRGFSDKVEAMQLAWRALYGDFSLQERMKMQEQSDAEKEHERQKVSASGAVTKKRNSRSGSLTQSGNPRTPPQTESFADQLAQAFDEAGMDERYFQTLGN